MFEVVGRPANQGFDDVGQFFCHPICYGTPTGHYGPEEGANFVDFGQAIKLGGTALMGYSFLFFWLLSPSVCFMSLGVCMSLILSLVVGSLLSTL